MSDAPKKTRKPKAITPDQAAKIEGAFEAAMAAKRQQEMIEAFGGTKASTKPPVTQEGLETELAAFAQDVAKKKIGRPSTRTPAVVKEICDRLSSGEPLRAICRDPRMPGWDTVYDWMARDEGFALQVAQARENGVEAIAQDTLAMIDAEPRYVEDAKGGTRIDAGYVQWLKLRTEQRMKLLACWSPNRYGNRVQVAGDKDNPLQINIQATEMFDSILKNAEMTRQIEE
jgi:transposase